MFEKNKHNTIEFTRLYDAPVKMVWDAWCDPEQAAKWWGPRGFTITTHSKDLRPGGNWDYTMHGPDGVDYPNVTQYFFVEKYSRLLYDHGGSKGVAPLFTVDVRFTDVKGKTRMDMSMTFENEESRVQIAKFIKAASGNSTWDRLGEYLEKESSGKEQFMINRSFDVPLETMFQMWTDPNHFSKWLPPTGFKMEFIKKDIKAGGSTFYFMTDGGNTPMSKMYGRAEYKEITKPNRLVYTQQFCDENEKITRHPMAPTWPETMLTTVTLAEEGPNSTRVTITWEPTGAVSKEEMETFIAARTGMTQGWTGSFDKLDTYLAETQRAL